MKMNLSFGEICSLLRKGQCSAMCFYKFVCLFYSIPGCVGCVTGLHSSISHSKIWRPKKYGALDIIHNISCCLPNEPFLVTGQSALISSYMVVTSPTQFTLLLSC